MLTKRFTVRSAGLRNVPRSSGSAWASVHSCCIQKVMRSGSLEAWVRLHLLPKCRLGTHGITHGSEPGPAPHGYPINLPFGAWRIGRRGVSSFKAVGLTKFDCRKLLAQRVPLVPRGTRPPRCTMMASESDCCERVRHSISKGHVSTAIKALQAAPLAQPLPRLS